MPSSTHKIPPLPKGKTVVQVFADFLQYHYNYAHDDIAEAFDGKKVSVLEATARYSAKVINNRLMRQATIKAGLIPNTPDHLFFFLCLGEKLVRTSVFRECGPCSTRLPKDPSSFNLKLGKGLNKTDVIN